MAQTASVWLCSSPKLYWTGSALKRAQRLLPTRCGHVLRALRNLPGQQRRGPATVLSLYVSAFLPVLLYHLAPPLHSWHLVIDGHISPRTSCSSFSVPLFYLIRSLQSWRNLGAEPTSLLLTVILLLVNAFWSEKLMFTAANVAVNRKQPSTLAATALKRAGLGSGL